MVDLQLLLQCILYFSAVITGLVTSIPTGLTFSNFKGNCILYGDVTWSNTDKGKFTFDFGKAGSCHFVTYTYVIVCIFFAFPMGGYYCFALLKSLKDSTIGSQMWVLPYVMLNAAAALITFVASCVISVGLDLWCGHLTEGEAIDTCAHAQNAKFIDKDDDTIVYNGATFYNYLTVAKVSAWIGFLIFLAQVVLCVVRFFRNRAARSQGDTTTAPQETTSDKAQFANQDPTA